MSRGQYMQWTAEQTLSYINGLLKADNDEDDNTTYSALSIAYEYLINATKRKITWSLSLQKLAYQFIDLAFETNMHSSIKDVFKSYRAITQGQYSESLKCVLEHYRDTKLQTILEELTAEDMVLIKDLPNIEIDDPSTEIIMQSMHPDVIKHEMEIKGKLKIVWEGYKSIVETVRVNQKLEAVYMATLSKIFDFVDRYNRVHEFKGFCRSLRTGLQSAFNKRDRTYQEKTIYIDIEKTDVNTRNIEIRMEQFKVITKLGLWGDAFSVLEDINTLMRIRKAPLKNSLRCQYFESLALLFSKNNFWHFHAFAYYNYYLAYLTKPKITADERQSFADKLILSILVIPAVTIESQQSKEIKEKLSAMMISSTKVPDRNQLEDLMVSKGVLENASSHIRELWNFMFLEFGVGSLKRGLEFVSELKPEHANLKELIEACLINKQLISIAQIYQRIRIQSLERLIPLPLPQIKKMLIKAHRQRTIDFTFDESQGIIVFEDHSQQANPTEEFHNLFLNVAIACEKGRFVDETHIRRKAEDYMANAEKYIWENRSYQIDEFRRKLKKQLPELRRLAMQKHKAEQQKKANAEFERIAKKEEEIRLQEEAQKLLATKKIIINDIITIKEQRVVRLMDKKIQNLTDEEIDNIELETFTEHLQLTKRRITNNKEARLRKAFTHIDYLERQRRDIITQQIQKTVISPEDEANLHQQCTDIAKKNYHDHNEQRARLQNLAKVYKKRVQSELQKVYNQFDKDTEEYHERLEENFKDKIIAKAKALYEETLKKKEYNERLLQEHSRALEEYQDFTGKWTFAKKKAPEPSSMPSLARKQQNQAPITMSSRPPAKTTSSNPYEKLEMAEEAPKRPEGKWGIGTKINTNTEPKAEEVKREFPITKIEKPAEVKAESKWSLGKKIEEVKPTVPEPVVVEKKAVFAPAPLASTTTEGVVEKKKWGAPAAEKKDEKKTEVKKGKAW